LGCDSIVTIDLKVNPTYQDLPTPIVICQGDSVLFGNYYYKLEGIYNDTLQTSLGCDSIVSLDLKVNPVYQDLTPIVICQGDSVLFGNQYYKIEGIYTDTLQTVNGCDSIVSLNLTINPIIRTLDIQTVCENDIPFRYGDSLITTTGKYNFVFQSKTTGCDSLVELQLEVLPISKDSITITYCDSYNWNGIILTESGIYNDTIRNHRGCDSVLILNLILGHHSSTTIPDTVTLHYDEQYDDFYDIVIRGLDIRGTDTIYEKKFLTPEGCDSIIKLNIKLIRTEIKIPNVITPDRNGFNDVFAIKGLDINLENRLLIYDRWGRLVFEYKNYPTYCDDCETVIYNAEQGFTAKNLADGVYYYVFKYNNQVYNGSLTVIRN
jgi:gliding motility-associated-like protein